MSNTYNICVSVIISSLLLSACSSDSSSTTPSSTGAAQFDLTGDWDITEVTTALSANCPATLMVGDVTTYTLTINQLPTQNANGFELELDDGVNVFTNTNADGLIDGTMIDVGFVYDVSGGQLFVNGVGLMVSPSGDGFSGALTQEVFSTVAVPPVVTCTETVNIIAIRQGVV